jgi:creatinine amidohydrolase
LPDSIFLEEMTWVDVQDLLKRTKTILVPTGSIEQHGPHLPLNSDVVAPLEVSLRVAKKLGTVVAPPLRPGVSAHHLPFPGTITLRSQTFIELVKDYARSLASHGFDPIVFVNGHGGNSSSLAIATSEARNELSPTKVIGFNWYEFIPKNIGHATSFDDGFHANAQETSWILALRPDQVKMERAKREMPEASETIKMSENFYIGMFRTFKDVTDSGILGDATKADAEMGMKLVDGAAENITKAIEEVVKNPPY